MDDVRDPQEKATPVAKEAGSYQALKILAQLFVVLGWLMIILGVGIPLLWWSERLISSRACHQLRRITEAARWMAPRKLTARLS